MSNCGEQIKKHLSLTSEEKICDYCGHALLQHHDSLQNGRHVNVCCICDHVSLTQKNDVFADIEDIEEEEK
jgi:hypothetical protein